MQQENAAAAPVPVPIQKMGGSVAQAFSDGESFALAYRMANMLASSDLVPDTFKEKPGNCMLALDMANRVGASVFMVMQNTTVINGRPGWSSQYVIAALNTCGLFSPLKFHFEPLGKVEVSYDVWEGPKGQRTKSTKKTTVENIRCHATARDKATGEEYKGPPVSIEMAVRQGWYFRDGSKWQDMAELMLTYRAAAFFGRIYAPHVLMGMHSADELQEIDITPVSETLGAEPVATPAAAANPAASTETLNAEIQKNAAQPARRGRPPKAAPAPAPAAGTERAASGKTRPVVLRDTGEVLGESDALPVYGEPFEFNGVSYEVVQLDERITLATLAPAPAAETSAPAAEPAGPAPVAAPAGERLERSVVCGDAELFRSKIPFEIGQTFDHAMVPYRVTEITDEPPRVVAAKVETPAAGKKDLF